MGMRFVTCGRRVCRAVRSFRVAQQVEEAKDAQSSHGYKERKAGEEINRLGVFEVRGTNGGWERRIVATCHVGRSASLTLNLSSCTLNVGPIPSAKDPECSIQPLMV